MQGGVFGRVGQAFELRGAPFGVWYFKVAVFGSFSIFLQALRFATRSVPTTYN